MSRKLSFPLAPIVAVPLLFGIVAVATAGGFETPMEVAAKLSREYRASILARDADRIERGSTADFVLVDARGRRMARAQAMGAMRAGLRAMTAVKSVDVRVVSARRAEGGIVYVSESKIVALINAGGPKPAKMEASLRDEWLAVPKGGRWLVKRARILKDDTRIDGKRTVGG